MILHFHTAIVPNSGELKRMKNIDRDVCYALNEKSIEVVFYSAKKDNYVKTQGQFTLSENVEKKYYIKQYRFMGRITRMFVFVWLCLKYHPSFIIGERGFYPNLIWVFRLFSPKTKLVCDIHGAVAEEIEYQGYPTRDIESARDYERKSVQNVDYVICQSDEMKRYIVNNYNVSKESICVYRCGIDTSLFHLDEEARLQIRNDLGVQSNDLLFVYSGGLHPWQRVEESIDIFERLHQQNSHFKLIVLTGDKEGLKSILTNRNIDNEDEHIMCMTLSFVQVPKYLNACDIAFLLRHNHAMNAVASPTKLAEYMACGLPVITSDVSGYWVDNDGLKYFINESFCLNCNDVDFVRKLEQIRRENVSRYAIDKLSLTIDNRNIKFFFETIKH